MDTLLPQVPLLPKRTCLASCTAGSTNAPIIMGPPVFDWLHSRGR